MGELLRLGRAAAVVLAAGTGLPACAADAESVLKTIALPDGFAIEIYARVPGARSMAVASDLNAVFVGTRGDSVYAIVDENGDGSPDRVVKVVDGLKVANGIAWRDKYLYVAEQHRIVRFHGPDIEGLRRARPEVLHSSQSLKALASPVHPMMDRA